MSREHTVLTTSGGSSYDLFTVNGTRFCFPSLPPKQDVMPAVYASIAGHRERILSAAAKVQYRKPARPRRSPRPKPGTGEFIPEPGRPGAPIDLNELGTGEVWALAPGGKLWATRGDSYVHATAAGTVISILQPGQVPTLIVAEICDRSAAVVADTVVPTPKCTGPLDSPEFTAALELRERALTWARATLAHQLYPSRYPHPGVFTVDAGTAAAAA